MTKKKTTAARRARALQHATSLKYTEAFRAVHARTPEAVLASALRRARLTTEAANLEWTDRELAKAAHDPSLIDDYLCIDREETLTRAVFVALATAATHPSATFLLAPTVGALDALDPAITADFIRGQQLGPVPDPVETAGRAAQLARAAAQALVDATLVPFGGDEEWHDCITLIEQARELARQAAASST